MTFQPVTPQSGLPGWAFLTRTKAKQSALFSQSPEIKRDIDYFTKKIGSITTAADLVKDRQLLKVALGAYGLDTDLDKRFFVQKVLQEGTSNPKALANRLVDKRYSQLTDSFGFGSPLGPKTGEKGFADRIISAFKTRQFEIAVGKKDETLRLAMSFKREISVIAANPGNGDTGWYRILGSPPLKKVVQETLNLPSSFSSLDIDRQLSVIKERIREKFGPGGVSVFSKGDNAEKFVKSFLVAREISGESTRQLATSPALTLLRSDGGSLGNSQAMEAILAALY